MEIQCLQEALKVEVQCHQVKKESSFYCKLFVCGVLSEWLVCRKTHVRERERGRGIKREMFGLSSSD